MHMETARPDLLLAKWILATKFSQSEWDGADLTVSRDAGLIRGLRSVESVKNRGRLLGVSSDQSTSNIVSLQAFELIKSSACVVEST